jgi:hypothetical protein
MVLPWRFRPSQNVLFGQSEDWPVCVYKTFTEGNEGNKDQNYQQEFTEDTETGNSVVSVTSCSIHMALLRLRRQILAFLAASGARAGVGEFKLNWHGRIMAPPKLQANGNPLAAGLPHLAIGVPVGQGAQRNCATSPGGTIKARPSKSATATPSAFFASNSGPPAWFQPDLDASKKTTVSPCMVRAQERPASWELTAKTVLVGVTGQSLPSAFKVSHQLAASGIFFKDMAPKRSILAWICSSGSPMFACRTCAAVGTAPRHGGRWFADVPVFFPSVIAVPAARTMITPVTTAVFVFVQAIFNKWLFANRTLPLV